MSENLTACQRILVVWGECIEKLYLETSPLLQDFVAEIISIKNTV